MKIFVTGGLGFIGSNFILRSLEDRQTEIMNYDLLTYAADRKNLSAIEDDPRYELVVGDICNSNKVSQCIARFKPDAIVNFAAESHVDRSIEGPKAFLRTNVVGTQTLLDVAVDYWKNTPATRKNFKFLHVSTDEVYGALRAEDPPFTENSRYNPSSPYSASKASSDHFVRAYFRTYGFPTLITNCSNNYGPHQNNEKLIPTIIHRMAQFQSIPIYGDGTQVRDWLYVCDHCDAINSVMKHGTIGETYNIGGNCELSNIDVVRTIADCFEELLGEKQSNEYCSLIQQVTDRPGHDWRYAVDTQKINYELNWKPKFSFDVGIRSTVQWYLDNRLWQMQP